MGRGAAGSQLSEDGGKQRTEPGASPWRRRLWLLPTLHTSQTGAGRQAPCGTALPPRPLTPRPEPVHPAPPAAHQLFHAKYPQLTRTHESCHRLLLEIQAPGQAAHLGGVRCRDRVRVWKLRVQAPHWVQQHHLGRVGSPRVRGRGCCDSSLDMGLWRTEKGLRAPWQLHKVGEPQAAAQREQAHR